jgi:hypothetical protein
MTGKLRFLYYLLKFHTLRLQGFYLLFNQIFIFVTEKLNGRGLYSVGFHVL